MCLGAGRHALNHPIFWKRLRSGNASTDFHIRLSGARSGSTIFLRKAYPGVGWVVQWSDWQCTRTVQQERLSKRPTRIKISYQQKTLSYQ